MDCRRTLFMLAGLLSGSFGCVTSSGLPATANSEPPPIVARKDDQGKRQFKPTTLVALGVMKEESAKDPQRTPAEQQSLRDEARRSYQQALVQDAKDLSALTALARLYVTIGDHERAVKSYMNAVKIYSKESFLWYELGMCHAQAKDWEPAIANLEHAVQLDPEQRRYVSSLGFCLARAGKYDESFAVFAQCEGKAMAHFHLAQMLHYVHEDKLSKEHVQQALEINPQFVEAQKLLTKLDYPTSENERGITGAVSEKTN